MGKRLYSQRREAFRDLLRQVRGRAGMTQIELSVRLGRPQSFVSECERGHRRLDWVAVTEYLEACDQDLVQFAQTYQRACAGMPASAPSQTKRVALARSRPRKLP